MGFLQRIHDRVTADSEQQTDSEGYLSTRAEWHAAAWGFSVAFLAMLVGQPQYIVVGIGWLFTRAADGETPSWLPYPKQFVKESGYLLGHAVAGAVFGIAVRVLF